MPLSKVLPALLIAAGVVLTGGLALGAGIRSAPLPAASRGPRNIAFTPNGALAIVTESDSGTLAVIERTSGHLLKRIDLEAKAPEGVAAISDEAALITSPLSGSVMQVDLSTGKVTSRLRLLGEPSEAAVMSGRTAFISVSALDQVVVLDLPTMSVRTRIPVGRRPRALALTPDGKTLLAAGFQDGSVSVIDTTTLKESRRLQLGGINLRDVAVSPDGRAAYVSGQVPVDTRVTWVANDVWVNTLFRIDLTEGAKEPVSEGRLDAPNYPCPDPDGIAVLPDGRVAIAVTGIDEALLVETSAGSARYFDATVRTRTTTGAQPRGLALTPDRREVWVAENVGSGITILDAQTLVVRRRVALPAEGPADPALMGRYLFSNAGMTAGRQFTCNSCHPDGRPDGQTWSFVHVPDGLAERNTRSLRGGVAGTAPFRWSGRETEIGLFLQDEIEGLLHGHKQSEGTLKDLARHLESLSHPPNPHRNEDGGLPEAAERGRTLFVGKAGCASCHGGGRFGGGGKRIYVGTTPDDLPLDVPHLQGVYDTAPYLHDGRATTLETVFSRHNGFRKHGKAHELGASEIADLLSYVRSL